MGLLHDGVCYRELGGVKEKGKDHGNSDHRRDLVNPDFRFYVKAHFLPQQISRKQEQQDLDRE